MNQVDQRVPVTILTGFLGSGKTTLLNYVLQQPHGYRIAVIENEFGETGIDNELLISDASEQIVEMNNGCICCTVRGDLVRILGDLAARRAAGTAKFDYVLIETTGLADPAPVAQTFFVDDEINRHYVIDGIVTLVDAVHAQQQLDEHHEAQEQVGFADRLLISKTDVVDAGQVAALEARLRHMNARAGMLRVVQGVTAVDQVLGLKGFNLDAILDIDPKFLDDVDHDHDDDIGSLVFRSDRTFDQARLETFMSALIHRFGNDLLRYKGVISIEGMTNRVIFQGVHMMMGGTPGRPWAEHEPRSSTMVFIGRNLPKEMLLGGLDACLV